MNKEIKDNLLLLGLFIVILISFVIFFNNTFTELLRMLLAFFWLFILPGFWMWKGQDFTERIILGTVTSFLIGIPMYYTGLLGLHLKYFAVYPAIVFIIIYIKEIIKVIKEALIVEGTS